MFKNDEQFLFQMFSVGVIFCQRWKCWEYLVCKEVGQVYFQLKAAYTK